MSFIGCSSTSTKFQFIGSDLFNNPNQKVKILDEVDSLLNNNYTTQGGSFIKKVDKILTNGNIAQFHNDSIYYIYGNLSIVDGKIDRILDSIPANYSSKLSIIDLKGAYVYPGFIDAHAHFLYQGMALKSIDLVGTKSWEKCIEIVKDFMKKNPNEKVYRGQGWDQNNWKIKKFPNNSLLEGLSDKPIILSRIDGHAILANSLALKQSKIDLDSKIEGGEILIENKNLTGLLIDNAQSLLSITKPNNEEKSEALLAAQEKAFEYGLTGIHEAGLPTEDIMLIAELQRKKRLKMPLYVMVSESPIELDYWIKVGPLKTDLLDVRSFKFYSDGSLGSRGALMRESYSDRENHFGLEVRSLDYMKSAAERIANNGWQMNTHSIGDSANRRMLNIYKLFIDILKKKDLRWRIEHAQVVHPDDRLTFGLGIIPSVQPSHATSDMSWAMDRIGQERLSYAYAYSSLRKSSGGILPLGTDFPVESMNPLHTMYSAISRKSLNKSSEKSFQIQEALTREQALIGMTRDAAYASFQEKEVGQIKLGMWANFSIFTSDIIRCPEDSIPKLKVSETWIHGEQVYVNHVK